MAKVKLYTINFHKKGDDENIGQVQVNAYSLKQARFIFKRDYDKLNEHAIDFIDIEGCE